MPTTIPRLPLLLLAALPLGAQASPKETLDLIFSTQRFQSVALSPDGRTLVWEEARPNADRTPSNHAEIFVRAVAGGVQRRLTAGNGRVLCDEHGATWSRDGTRIAFLSDVVQGKQLQLYVVSAAGGTPRCLTHLTGFATAPKWSPDGRTIALLNIPESQAAAGAVEAAERESGEIRSKVNEERLTLVDVATGATRTISPPDTYVYEYDWSPDSRRIVGTAAKGNGDNNWWIATLQVFAADGGAPRELFRPTTQIAIPRWSPDGSQVAVIQGLMSDHGSTGGEIWLVPVDGGTPRNLTPGRPSSPSWLLWRGSGRLLFSESVDGGRGVSEIATATGRVTALWRGDEGIDSGDDTEVASLSVADDGTSSAVVRSSLAQPPEVWVGPVGAWSPVTHANDALRPHWGRAEKIKWRSDGRTVQGWLVYPRNFDPAKRYPLMLTVHGGPASLFIPTWPYPGTSLLAPVAAEGYFVFCANPRGSFGQGEAFTAANIKDFGYGDFRDIMSGVDAALASAPIDPNRLGIGGWSYGGYMTMWAITQTNRFRAAVAGAGVVNMQSYYGQNLIDEWMIPYFGASVYDDPAIYARSSPLTFIKNARTPTLIIVGDSDKECPSPQSYECWHALRTLGVETTLVIYKDEGHHFRNPADIEDSITRSVDWLNARLK